MNIQTIYQVLFGGTTCCVARRFNKRSLCGAAFLLLGGLLAFMGLLLFDDKSSAPVLAAGVLGALLCIGGICRLTRHTKEWYYTATGSALRTYHLFYDLRSMPQLMQALEAEHLGELPSPASAPVGNLRLDVVISEDAAFAAVQLMQFVPYTYSPLMHVRFLSDEEVKCLLPFLTRG